MQKKLIALAIAGLSGAAFAQSNVTVYGVMDTTWESVKATGATTVSTTANQASMSRLANNSSNIGFKGSEALGNGLTAVFQIETGVASDAAGAAGATGAGTAFGAIRDTFVGVAGGFGTVVAGTLTHPMRAYGAKVDFNPGASGSGFTGSIYGEFNGVKAGTDDRASNAIAYVSPSFNGFSVIGAYVNGESRFTNENGNGTTAKNRNSRAWQLAAQYENGPLFVGYAHHDAKDPNVVALGATAAAAGAANDNEKFKADRIVGKYEFASKTTVSALWDKQKYNLERAAGTTGDAVRKAWMIGANQNFGAHNVWLQFAKAKDATGTLVDALADTSAKQVTLGYSYALSKRTMVHAFYSKITNGNAGEYDFYVNGAMRSPASTTALGASDGADPTAYGVGIRHSF